MHRNVAVFIAAFAIAAGAAVRPALSQELRRSAFVGVQIAAVPENVRRDTAVAAGGVFVQALVEGGSAQAAGIRAGDVIMTVGDHAIADVADFLQLTRTLRAGDIRRMRVRRAGQTVEIEVPIRARPYEHADDLDVTYGAIQVDGSLRRTIVTAPRQPGRHPAILYVNGIGCFSQESLDLSSNDARLLYGLTRAGFVTMRVEKSGIGDSEGPPCASEAADFRAEVRAYTAGLRALKNAANVAADRVFLVGLSIGGVEAPLIAADESVRGLVVVNTVAKPFFEYLLDTRRRQLLLGNVPYDEIDRRMALDERCNHRLLIDKQPPDAVVKADAACADYVTYPAPFTFMQQWADVNIGAAWKAIDRPVLVAFGSSDFVASNDDAPYLAAMINAFHPGRATLQRIDGMDHGMNKAATMAESFARTRRAEFQTTILDTIASWLRSNAS